MNQMMQRLWIWTAVLFAGIMFISPVWGQEKEIEDITEEVLEGPSDLNPEKILGPGGIGINTHKNILMSFGATVRIIPTLESDWDFGLSEEVPGYFNTGPVKQYAGSALTAVSAGINAVEDAYQTSLNFNSQKSATDPQDTISAFNAFTTELSNSKADLTAINSAALTSALDGVSQLEAGALGIQALSQGVGTQADAIYAQSGAAGLVAAATQAGQAYAETQAALANDPDNATLQQQAAVAGGTAAGLQAAATAVAGDSSQGANAGAIAQAGTINAMSDSLVDGTGTVITGLTAGSASLTVLKAKADSFSPYYLANSFLKTHSNESGSVNDGYIRTETKMYFNAMPKDKKWSFYAALEFDKPIDTETVDNRGGRNSDSSNFGLERLNASIELVDGLRLHGGWDIWGMDIIEAGSMVYGDDNPGFWLKGDYDTMDFSVAWIKLEDNDFQNSAADHESAADEDRDLIAGYFDYYINGDKQHKIRGFYGYDRIRSVPSADLTGVLAASAGLADYAGIYGNNNISGAEATSPDTDAHTIGGYYVGKFGIVEVMGELAYKFGSADDTGLKGVDNGVTTIEYDDFDISAYAGALDVAFELKDLVGWHSFKPHVGFMYTSGDDDPTDDKLEGFTGITSAQRFSRAWGGENTIPGDTNFVLGTTLYGFIPEYYGNGTPVFTGGLQNSAGTGAGRGDNPGVSMLSLGMTLRPKIFLIYRTNVNMFWWNEDFYVANMVDPIEVTATGLRKSRYTLVEADYVGTEWDNEVTLALSKNMFIKGQGSLFFPGDGIENVTNALSGGTETDEIATRFALELIWNF